MKDKLELGKELESKLRNHLKSKKPLFGSESPFSGLLQSMVNTIPLLPNILLVVYLNNLVSQNLLIYQLVLFLYLQLVDNLFYVLS